jgi:outer membrane protein assembly factor BamB
VIGDMVYYGTGGTAKYFITQQASLGALDRKTGTLKWRKPVPLLEGALFSGFAGSLVYADGKIIAAGLDGTLQAFAVHPELLRRVRQQLDSKSAAVLFWRFGAVAAAQLLRPHFSGKVPATRGKLRFEFDGRGEGQKPGRDRVSPGGAGSSGVAVDRAGSASGISRAQHP